MIEGKGARREDSMINLLPKKKGFFHALPTSRPRIPAPTLKRRILPKNSVPFNLNLLSERRITSSFNCQVTFWPTFCVIQDLTTKKNIGVGEVAEATNGSCARNLLALFNKTIRPAYGKCGKATESEIVAAAELANVHKFVSGLLQVSFYTSGRYEHKFCMYHPVLVWTNLNWVERIYLFPIFGFLKLLTKIMLIS